MTTQYIYVKNNNNKRVMRLGSHLRLQLTVEPPITLHAWASSDKNGKQTLALKLKGTANLRYFRTVVCERML